MKKALLFLASAALLFAGCKKEQIAVTEGNGDTVEVTVNAQLLNEEQTKASWDSDGAGACVDHWIMEVYDAQDKLFDRQEKTDQSGLTNTFSVILIKNQEYKFAFWADKQGSYNTAKLTEVKTVSTVAGLDSRDAFFAKKDYTSSASETITAELHRPFAQINVVTLDLAKIHTQMSTAHTEGEYSKYIPEDLKLTCKTYNQFNVLDGTVSDEQDTELTLESCYGDFSAHDAKTTIFMDYLFAGADKELKDLAFTFNSNEVAIDYDFKNIPLQRNYRTNIKGNLLSNDATVNVEIISDWDGNHDPEFTTEGSVADAIQALAAGKTAIEITAPEDYANPVAMPAEANGKDVSINVIGVTGKDMTFELADGAQGPANLYITSDAQNLEINLSNSHVEVNGGTYQTVKATTSATTLLVGKDVTIASLEVEKGNVEIHGKVASLTRKEGEVIKAAMYASDRETLINYINWAKSGDTVGLECDIDLAGENWTPLRQGNNRYTATFDGQGHTISNMTIATDMQNGVGFFSDMTGGAVIKNFTMTGADISNTTADKGNMWGIISGYAYGNVTFENITVTDSQIHAFGKVAGILGMAADADGTTVVKNCKVENTEIIGCYNVANYVGLVQNAIILEGCTSTNVEKKLGGRYGEDSYVTFDNVQVINDTTDPANPVYVLSSGKYWKNGDVYYSAFADYYNDHKYDSWKALDGTVDGLVFNTLEEPERKPLTDWKVSTVAGLKDAVKSINAISRAGEFSIELAAGTYEVSDLVLWQNYAGKSLVIKAAEGADVTFKPVASGNKSPYIFLVAGGSEYDATRAISINGIKFDYTQAADIDSAPVYCCTDEDTYVNAIEGSTSESTRYAHNITFNNCSLTVFSGETQNISFIAGPAGGSPKDVAFNNCTMTNGGYIHSGYIEGIICDNCTVTGVKALINSQAEALDYIITIKNSTINSYYDYVVRTSGGEVVVENNVFTATYDGTDNTAGVIVLRKEASGATFTGNTFTKSSSTMWDCYCVNACTVNGEAKTAGTGINF